MENRKKMETYQEPWMEQILLPTAEVFTLNSAVGPGDGVVPKDKNGTNDWLQSW